jgi:ketosteroid isomerase-like protein
VLPRLLWASAPEEELVTLGTSVASQTRLKRALAALTAGDMVRFVGPIGRFTVEGAAPSVVMLGQGLGVTPFRAMLWHLALTGQDTATTLVHVGATHPFRADTESIATRAVYPRDAFARVDDHDYAALAGHFAPDLHHRFAGRHALGGERHDAATVLAWLERVGRVLPELTFAITDVTRRRLAAQHHRRCPLERSCHPRRQRRALRNRGVHVVRMRWFTIVDMDVHLDSEVLRSALDRQAAAGIDEATQHRSSADARPTAMLKPG